jgi:hypothetical protein
MTFSLKATIRAWLAPRHRLSCPSRYWREIVGELYRRGENRHEAGVFLLGVQRDGRREVQAAIYYDDLDPRAYQSGVCVLHGDAFAKLWALCRERKLTVVADAHTHGGDGTQSESDRTNPMVARPGHIAIIVPDLAHWPIRRRRLGIYEYLGQHSWTDRSARSRGFFYNGLWS